MSGGASAVLLGQAQMQDSLQLVRVHHSAGGANTQKSCMEEGRLVRNRARVG